MENNLKEELIQALFKLKKLNVGMRLGSQTKENECDISLAELVLMKAIADNTSDSENNTSLTEIRVCLSISKAAISQMLGVLEKKGYINRDIDKNNRRNLIVTLTPKGHDFITRKRNYFDEKLTKIVSIIGEDDMKQMIVFINRLTEAIEKINNEST